MQYKNLFFDLDDTLWAFSFNARDTFEEMYRKYEYDRYFRSFEHFYELYEKRNIELWAEYADGKVTKEELNRQRFLYPLEAVGEGDAALAKAFSDDFFAVIPTKSRLMPHAQEVLEYLAPKYNLYILSNGFQELQCHKMRSAGIDHYFKKVGQPFSCAPPPHPLCAQEKVTRTPRITRGEARQEILSRPYQGSCFFFIIVTTKDIYVVYESA